MITGANSIIYSTDPDADRAFLRDVLEFPNIDVGEGWLIFGLPPAEVAVHPSDQNDVHEFYLMCDDVTALIATMRTSGIDCGPVLSLGWGMLTHIPLPGGGKIGVYQPRHARPTAMAVRKGTGRNTARAAGKPLKASSTKSKISTKARPSKRSAKALAK